MVIDEAAYIKENAFQEAILPTLTAIGKKCLIISTPKSKNWFYKYYLKGVSDSIDYVSFRGHSTDNPYIDQSFIAEQKAYHYHQTFIDKNMKVNLQTLLVRYLEE